MNNIKFKEELVLGSTLLSVAAGTFISFRRKVCLPNQFLAKTGWGVKKVKVCKKTIQWPGQIVKFYDMHPVTYEVVVEYIRTKDLIRLNVPVKLSIAPIDPERNLNGFTNYITKVGNMPEQDLKILVQNFIINKTSEFTASVTSSQIIDKGDEFKAGVISHMERELSENGFYVAIANIGDIRDPHGCDYFKNLENISAQIILDEQSNRLKIRGINKQKELELSKIQSHKITEIRKLEAELEVLKLKEAVITKAKPLKN
jgi:flotillin